LPWNFRLPLPAATHLSSSPEAREPLTVLFEPPPSLSFSLRLLPPFPPATPIFKLHFPHSLFNCSLPTTFPNHWSPFLFPDLSSTSLLYLAPNSLSSSPAASVSWPNQGRRSLTQETNPTGSPFTFLSAEPSASLSWPTPTDHHPICLPLSPAKTSHSPLFPLPSAAHRPFSSLNHPPHSPFPSSTSQDFSLPHRQFPSSPSTRTAATSPLSVIFHLLQPSSPSQTHSLSHGPPLHLHHFLAVLPPPPPLSPQLLPPEPAANSPRHHS